MSSPRVPAGLDSLQNGVLYCALLRGAVIGQIAPSGAWLHWTRRVTTWGVALRDFPSPGLEAQALVDYEKGSPAWDIGMVLTRHAAGFDDELICARVESLRETARRGLTAADRLHRSLARPCTCGAGDSPSERSSIGSEVNEGSHSDRAGIADALLADERAGALEARGS